MSERSRRWVEAALLGAVLFLLTLPFVFGTGYFEDEFSSFNHAKRMLAGAVIYRDFFEPTGPLLHWTAAWLFRLWGPEPLVPRLFQSLALGLGGAQLYVMARSSALPRWASALPGLALVLALFRIWPGYSHHWMIVPFVLGALMAARGAERGREWALAGGLAGIATLFVQSDGLVLAIALSASLLFDKLVRPERAVLRDLAVLWLGWLVPTGLAALYFAANGALGDAWYDMWVFPLTRYRVPGGINDVAFGSDFLALLRPMTTPFGWPARVLHFCVLFALLPVAALLVLLQLGRALATRHAPRHQPASLPLAFAALGFALLATRGRADFIHVAEYAMLPLLFLCITAARRTPVRRLALLGPIAAFTLTGGGMYASQLSKVHDFGGPDRGASRQPLVQYLQAHTTDGDTIEMLPYGGYTAFYSRALASRYTLMVPPELGYHTEAEYQAFWREVVSRQPKFIVLSSCGNEVAMLEGYRRDLPINYELVTRLPNPQFGPAVQAFVYEKKGL